MGRMRTLILLILNKTDNRHYSRNSNTFTIKHYAGDVTYAAGKVEGYRYQD